MNIIYIKQALKVKCNKRDTEKAIVKELTNIFETTEDNIEVTVLNTNSIEGIAAGGSVLLACTTDLEKYAIISIGASTKDIQCITDDVKDAIYSFEYVLTVDKKVFKGKGAVEAVKDINTNDELSEALRMMGMVANTAKYDTLLSGRYGAVEDKADCDRNKYSGILITDFTSSNDEDINIEVTGRRGKLHLLRIVPILSEEMKVIKYLQDSVMTDLIALAMVKDNKGSFDCRHGKFNFASVLPVTEDTASALNIEADTDGKAIIDTFDKFESFMNYKF